jgi:hypothetical protein
MAATAKSHSLNLFLNSSSLIFLLCSLYSIVRVLMISSGACPKKKKISGVYSKKHTNINKRKVILSPSKIE